MKLNLGVKQVQACLVKVVGKCGLSAVPFLLFDRHMSKTTHSCISHSGGGCLLPHNWLRRKCIEADVIT
jgi:hypothetical protein